MIGLLLLENGVGVGRALLGGALAGGGGAGVELGFVLGDDMRVVEGEPEFRSAHHYREDADRQHHWRRALRERLR
jgi:hypothetical protein